MVCREKGSHSTHTGSLTQELTDTSGCSWTRNHRAAFESGGLVTPLPITGPRPWAIWSDKSQSPQVLPYLKNSLLNLNKQNHISKAIYLLLSNSLSTSKWCYTALFHIMFLFLVYGSPNEDTIFIKMLKNVKFSLRSYNICNCKKDQRMEGWFATSLLSKKHHLSFFFFLTHTREHSTHTQRKIIEK